MINVMIKRISIIFVVSVMSLILIGGTASVVSAQGSSDEVCKGVELVGGDCKTDDSGKVDSLVNDVVNVLTAVIGVISVIMIMIAGFKYVTSGGDANKVSSAKDTILYAVIGIVVVVFAQVIVKFVINKL
jgi:hypothetical protein